MTALESLGSLEGRGVMDKAQRHRALFPALRVLADHCDAPNLTRSMRTAIEDLSLETVAVIHPVTKHAPMVDWVEAVPPAQLGAPGGLSAYLP